MNTKNCSLILILLSMLGWHSFVFATQPVHTHKPHNQNLQPVKGQIIVKFKDNVLECPHCLLKNKKSFKLATQDSSESLDKLFSK